MFCPKCGKEIAAGTNFCPNCGYNRNGIRRGGFSVGIFDALDTLFKRYDSGWIIKRIAVVFSVICLIIRIACNEITTIYNVFAADDYFAISDSGRSMIIAACAASALTSVGIVVYCKVRKLGVETKSLISTVVGIVISILLMLIRIPAPY